MNSIFTRTSVRTYLDKEIECEKIDRILRAAMASPTAGNQQAWEFYLTKDRDLIVKLSKCSPYASCLEKAPFAFIVCYRDDVKFPEYTQIDSAICCENMMLEIENQGLGSVMLGVAPIQDRMVKVKEILNLPENMHAFAILSCGYPIEKNAQQNRFDEKKIHIL